MYGQRSFFVGQRGLEMPKVWASLLSWMNRRVVAKASQANLRSSTRKGHKWEAKATGYCENGSI